MTAPAPDRLAELSGHDEHLIKHALGWPKNYRNSYVCDANSDDGCAWERLVFLGLATASEPCAWMSDMTVYRVTDAGRALITGAHHAD